MKILMLLLNPLLFTACSVTQSQVPNAASGIPVCINGKIGTFKSEPRQNPPRSITEYTYKGQKVYYISAPCCDQYGEVVDSTCKLLGHPDGGFTGKGDGSLPGFIREATNEKLIWKDER